MAAIKAEDDAANRGRIGLFAGAEGGEVIRDGAIGAEVVGADGEVHEDTVGDGGVRWRQGEGEGSRCSGSSSGEEETAAAEGGGGEVGAVMEWGGGEGGRPAMDHGSEKLLRSILNVLRSLFPLIIIIFIGGGGEGKTVEEKIGWLVFCGRRGGAH